MSVKKWAVEAGRLITFEGQSMFHIAKEGSTQPVVADGVTHFIVECLNSKRVTPDTLYRQHMGRPPAVREVNERGYSMSFGELPPFKKFSKDIQRPDPDHTDGSPYLAPRQLYPMELVTPEEIELARDFGGFEEFRTNRPGYAYGFRGNAKTIYEFLEYLIENFGGGGPDDDESAPAESLASSIMTTLGYEWI